MSRMLVIRTFPRALALPVMMVLVLSLPLLAQLEHSAPPTRIGWVPREFLERPVTLRSGIGSIREQISTSSEQARQFYNQGLAYLQSYVWLEAARSFHQSLRFDPNLAMAYLGLSYAYSPMDFAAANAAL